MSDILAPEAASRIDGRAIRINTSIYIARSDGHHVMNPTASPILTEAEAKWLTSELKRVLLSTGRSVAS